MKKEENGQTMTGAAGVVLFREGDHEFSCKEEVVLYQRSE